MDRRACGNSSPPTKPAARSPPSPETRPPTRETERLQVPWERNRIWIWDANHFTRCKRVTYAIVDVVTRYWPGYLLSSEQTSTQAQLLFAHALEDQRGAEAQHPGGSR